MTPWYCPDPTFGPQHGPLATVKVSRCLFAALSLTGYCLRWKEAASPRLHPPSPSRGWF